MLLVSIRLQKTFIHVMFIGSLVQFLVCFQSITEKNCLHLVYYAAASLL